MGSQDNSGTFYSDEPSLTICVYIYDGSYRLVSSLPWSDPTAPVPAPSQGGGQEDPSNGSESEDEVAATIYMSDARFYTRRFLRASKWRIGYSKRSKFRQRCHRVSRTKVRCSVRWRYRGTYKGSMSHRAYVEDGEQYISTRAKIAHRKPKRKSKRKPKRTPSGGKSCDSSYPTVCIPSPPPDLDCPEIAYQDFLVVGDDPHGFDGDRDGIGCES